MTEDDELDIPQRCRGRPKGAADSYKRTRKRTKAPPNLVEALAPRVKELIRVAKLAGYHEGMKNAGHSGVYDQRHDLKAIDDAEMTLLGEIRRVIDEGGGTVDENNQND